MNKRIMSRNKWLLQYNQTTKIKITLVDIKDMSIPLLLISNSYIRIQDMVINIQ